MYLVCGEVDELRVEGAPVVEKDIDCRDDLHGKRTGVGRSLLHFCRLVPSTSESSLSCYDCSPYSDTFFVSGRLVVVGLSHL